VSTPETLTPGEAELKRRLDDLASLATVGPEGWERFQERLAAPAPRRFPTRKQLLAVAAVILVVCAIVWSRRDGTGDRVHVVDTTTTTTSDHDRTPASSTSSTSATSTTSSSTPAPAEGGTSGGVVGSPTGADPGAGGDPGSGAGTGTGAGAATGPPAGGTAPGAGGGTGSPTTTPPATAPSTIDGKTVWASYATPDYTLLVTLETGASPYLTTTIYRDDGTLVRDWVWPDRPGQNCLVGVLAMPFDFPEGQHAYTFGLVRADAAAVRIVTGGGAQTTVAVGGEAHPGVRPWITRRQTDDVARMEALDAAGNVLTTATPSSFDSYPASC
jgi:hypothetical protein